MTMKSKQDFLDSDVAKMLRGELEEMVKSSEYNTQTIYSLVRSSGNQFVEKHIKYMGDHLTMDPRQYILNVKLMTKIRK